MFVTDETSHLLRSASNAMQYMKVPSMVKTLDTSQALKSALNVVASSNIHSMFVTHDTSQSFSEPPGLTSFPSEFA